MYGLQDFLTRKTVKFNNLEIIKQQPKTGVGMICVITYFCIQIALMENMIKLPSSI